MKTRIMRSGAAFVVAFALAIGATVALAPAASAHHPEITASSRCLGDHPVIEYSTESWSTSVSHDNIGIYVDGAWIESGAFNNANGWGFDGVIDAAGLEGQTVTVTARADGPWSTGFRGGDARSARVTVADGCKPDVPPTTPPTTVPPTTIPQPIPASATVAGSCSSDGFVVNVSASNATVSVDLDGNGAIEGTEQDLPAGTHAVTAPPGSSVVWSAKAATGAQFDDGSSVTNGTLEAEKCGPDATFVAVSLGACQGDDKGSSTPAAFELGDGVTVVVAGAGGTVATFDESTVIELEPGVYSWVAATDDDFEIDGVHKGELVIEDCTVPPVDGSVRVDVGECGAAEIVFSTPNVAVMTLIGPNGSFELSTSTSVDLTPGSYTWTAVAADGYKLASEQGAFDIEGCTEELPLDFNIELGECEEVRITFSDKDAAVMTINGPEGEFQLADSTNLDLGAGTYTWTLQLADGWKTDITSGQFVIDACQEVAVTTTTVPETTTTVPETTTTVPETTSTTEVPSPKDASTTTSSTTIVAEPTSTTVPPVTETELPFTGSDYLGLLIAGFGVLSAGAALLSAGRRKDDDPNHNLGTWVS